MIDQSLFSDTCAGLMATGWLLKGGGDALIIMEKGDAEIKVFPKAQNIGEIDWGTIIVRYSVPPKEEKP